MTVWRPANKIGIAIWNYYGDAVANRRDRLPLRFGEVVHIQEECDQWFYGYSLVAPPSEHRVGLFPKSYTLHRDYDPHTGSYTLEQEIVLTLHEWVHVCKQIFVNGDVDKFKYMGDLIMVVMGKYHILKSGQLTAAETNCLRAEIIEKIDLGNKNLDLDLVIRNADGFTLNPFDVSLIRLFDLHWEKSQRLRALFRHSNDSGVSATAQNRHSNGSTYGDYYPGIPISVTADSNNCYNFCVTLNNFICLIRQDMIIWMSIYDGHTHRIINENYIVKWNATGLVREVEKMNNIRVVFTDFSANDLYGTNKKLYLVCQIIRVGTMHVEQEKSSGARSRGAMVGQQQHSQQLKSGSSANCSGGADELKRPCGVAVYDLAEVIALPQDERTEIFVPLVPYSEKEHLDSLLKKVVQNPRDFQHGKSTGQGLIISVRMINSYKMQLLDRYRLYYSQYPNHISRKIGFRDIILPEDVRNDFYLTLVSGEFHKGNKKSERNIEVTVRVMDDNGTVVEKCLSVDSHNGTESVYRSVVYYHEDRPKWMETVKIVLPIERFGRSHLKFTFKHRSSNENKDKNEKPFALAYLPLMNPDGTALQNDTYRPIVYKFDPKKYNESDKSYLMLAATGGTAVDRDRNRRSPSKMNLDSNNSIAGSNNSLGKKPNIIYTASQKDSFTVAVVICSTKLAQNIKVLGLLNWRENRDSLEEVIRNVQTLEGGEIMKFLHDVLDALFDIWMDQMPDTAGLDRVIFDALVYIIKHLLQEKYIHFQEILNDYIEKHFSATLIHGKLVEMFQYYIENPDSSLSYQTVTSMEFIFKFIVHSRRLYAQLNRNRNREEFEERLDNLFELFTMVMDRRDVEESLDQDRDPMEPELGGTSTNLIKVKHGILKYFPKIIEHILSVFDEKKLTYWVIRLIPVPNDECSADISVQKLAFMHEIVDSGLFREYPECRRKMMPVIGIHLQTALVLFTEDGQFSYNEKLEKCLAIISDTLEMLANQHKEGRATKYDILDLAQILLPTMIERFPSLDVHHHGAISKDTTITTTTTSQHGRQRLWSIIISLLNQMTDFHYNEFLNRLTQDALETFLLDLLKIFRQTVGTQTESIYPADWNDMNFAQNIVMLKAMTKIVNFAKEKIAPISNSRCLWNEIFLTGIKYVSQKSLRLDHFSIRKRKRLETIRKDPRLEMVVMIRSLWYHLADQKHRFVPALIGPLLEVALLPVLAIRKDTIVIFFDMFYSCIHMAPVFRDEMLTQLDLMITSGRGDADFQRLLAGMFLELSENHPEEIRLMFQKFVTEVGEQIERLLTYREVVGRMDDNHESVMSCIMELLDFYDQIDRRELYIRYLYRLYDLHIRYENFNEAAYTLAKHECLLEWSDRPLERLLRSETYDGLRYNSHRELKERLYSDIIENFNKGQLWEAGIVYCKELMEQYENEVFDYAKLAQMFEMMAKFYRLIITSVRIEPEYFHVTYYGGGYPRFFRNKSFIYRGKSYERLFEFTKRLRRQFPNAQLLDKLDAPGDDILNSPDGQYLSIFKVDPKISPDVRDRFMRRLVDERILNYYQYNEISEFTFSRKSVRNVDSNNNQNEFASMWIERTEYRTAFPLPGILYRSEVVDKITYELDPLKNAIDTMEKMNERTRMIIFRYMLDDANVHPLHVLLMHIKGIVSSDVQGGVAKYEEAFFFRSEQEMQEEQQEEEKTEPHYHRDDLDRLKTLIADQIPLLALAIKLAEQKLKLNAANQTMDGLFQYIVESFEKMRQDVEQKYGQSELPEDMRKILANHYKMQQLACAEHNGSMQQSTQSQNLEHQNSIDGTATLTKRSIFARSSETFSNTLRFRKKDSSRRLNSESANSMLFASNLHLSQTQWYTGHKSTSTLSTDSVTEVEPSSVSKSSATPNSLRSSRPNSGHYGAGSRTSMQSQLSIFFPTSVSQISLEERPDDELPPPLPSKKLSVDLSGSSKNRGSSSELKPEYNAA